MKRTLLSSLFTLALVLGTAPLALPDDHQGGSEDSAQPAQSGQQRSIRLVATQAGVQLRARGTSSWKIRGNHQKFKVDIDATAADNTVFMINVDGSVVGSLKIRLGEAEFEIEGEDSTPLPPPLNPVTAIKQVTVLDASGTAVLQGSF